MKLISMHVDNYGGLHDYDYTFRDGLNVVLHDNGWGKTTMAAFLKAMLYGYDTRRSKDITENERKRYLPWQGGKYGGSLDFEAEGKRYRIYRTFGETPRFDTARIIDLDTNATARIPADKIGETLFHLDASAFQRSVFINQNGLSIDGAASSIHTRLNTLVSQANDVAAYDGAIARLTQQIKVYEKTGARGRLGDIARQIADQEAQRAQLEREIAAQDAAREKIVQINALLESISGELEVKNRQLETVAGEGKRQEATRQLLADISGRIAAFRQQIDQLRTELGGEAPTTADTDQMKQLDQKRTALRERLKTIEAEQAQLNAASRELADRYGKSMPAAAALDEIQRLHGELQGLLSADAADQRPAEVPEEYAIVAAAAGEGTDYVARLQEVIGASARLQDLHQQQQTLQSDTQRESETWASQTRRYATLRAEQEAHTVRLDALGAGRPAAVEPALEALQYCRREQAELSRREAELQADIRQEEKNRADTAAQHQELTKQAAALQQELDGQQRYSQAQVAPAIAVLEESQRLQQQAEALKVAAPASALTAEETALLAGSPDALPEDSEAGMVLERHRQMLRRRAEAQGLNSRLQGECSKRDSVQTSLAQLDVTAPKVAAEPKKGAGTALIGAGAALLTLGVALAVLVMPMLGVAAVLGAALMAAGFAARRNGQQQEQDWQDYQQAQKRYQAACQQQEQLRQQIGDAQRVIDDLQGQLAACERAVAADEAAVAFWLAGHGQNSADDPETAIRRIREQAAHLRQLRAKQAEHDALQIRIQAGMTRAAEARADVDRQYPDIAHMSCSEAIAYLHKAHTRQQLAEEQLRTARQRLDKFMKASGAAGHDPSAKTDERSAALRKELKTVAARLEKLAVKRAAIAGSYPEISDLADDQAIALLQQKLSAYQLEEGQLNVATRNLASFIRESGWTEPELQLPQSPRTAAMTAVAAAVAEEIAALVQQANEALRPLDLDTDAAHMVQALREAEGMLNVYQQHQTRLKDTQSRQDKHQQQVDGLKQRIGASLAAIGVTAEIDELPGTLPAIRRDVARRTQLTEKLADLARQHDDVKTELLQAETELDRFCTAHGHFEHTPEGLLAAICEKAAAHAELTCAMQQLDEQRASMAQAHQDAAGQTTADEAALRTAVTALKEKRETLLIEYTQHSDAIRQADRALERHLEVSCGIRQLYEQKQKAQHTLAALKRTIQLITAAKENLATRYLSKVEQLFNSYMQIWLKNSDIRGVLDIDFNVSIEENDKVHVAQGYSSGYCDMIDFCMRLALVDTLFEKEQPFLILDDPFVNLDASRLDNALELLNMMAAEKQIIYFVCHPIRAVETAENTALRSEFLQLAENARKTALTSRAAGAVTAPAARKTPREMYHVADTAASRALQVVNPNYTITNSIFSMRFQAGETAAAQDYCFELFFIDKAGRVLNDRQIIEISDGKLSAERIQFNLNTRDDSGDTFEMMIRQSGHDDYEVAARYPFRAKLAFTGTFSFDL